MKFIHKFIISLMICILGGLINLSNVLAHEIEGVTAIETYILTYVSDNNVSITSDTYDYETFLRDVIYWNTYPELSDGDMEDQIYDYARQYLEPEGGYAPNVISHAFDVSTLVHDIYLPIIIGGENSYFGQVRASAVPGYSGYDAAVYAKRYSENGKVIRAPDQPNFGDKYDCTAFVSQALEAGGFNQNGTGDCRAEWTSDEWYKKPSNSDCKDKWWLSNNQYAWSSTWVNADWFTYHQYHYKIDRGDGYEGFALVDQNNLQYIRAWGDLGEVVQLINKHWDVYHTMMITGKNDGEIYLTYHSSSSGDDVEDISLNDLVSTLPSDHRLILLEYFY